MCPCAEVNYSLVGTITVTTTALLVPDTPLSPTNTERVVLRLTTTPSGASNVPANVTLNGANVPVLDRYGNTIYGNQLSTGMVLKGYFGTNGIGATSHFIVVNYPGYR